MAYIVFHELKYTLKTLFPFNNYYYLCIYLLIIENNEEIIYSFRFCGIEHVVASADCENVYRQYHSRRQGKHAGIPAREPYGACYCGLSGGGYSHLSMQNEGTDWVGYFNGQGIAYGVLTYRMPKGDRTIPMSDAQDAVRMMRDSAAVWGINRNDVGIMGFSAGGHLASTTATHAPIESRPDFQILFYPVISMDEKQTHKGSVVGFLGDRRGDEKLVRQFSNDKQVRRHVTPPAILIMAGDDRPYLR